MPNLHRVSEGSYLHFPPEVDQDTSLWLAPGGVLDLDDPYIRHAVKGQEYKLEPAPEGDIEPDPISNGRMRVLREEFLGTAKPQPSDEELVRAEGAERAEEEGITGGAIQKPKVQKARKKSAEPAEEATAT